MNEIFLKPLNRFATNSHGRRVWSLARTSLKVKVNLGGLRAVYVCLCLETSLLSLLLTFVKFNTKG